MTVSDKEVIKPFGRAVSIVCHSSYLPTFYPGLVGNLWTKGFVEEVGRRNRCYLLSRDSIKSTELIDRTTSISTARTKICHNQWHRLFGQPRPRTLQAGQAAAQHLQVLLQHHLPPHAKLLSVRNASDRERDIPAQAAHSSTRLPMKRGKRLRLPKET